VPTQPSVQWVPGVKQLVCGFDHPTLSSAEIKEVVGLYIYSPWAFMDCSRVNYNFIYLDKLRKTIKHFSQNS